MKYKAVVILADPTIPGCPYPGCVQVIHPKLFGVQAGIGKLSDPKEIMMAHFPSPWIHPEYAHPMDYYVPAPGETVYIEQVEDGTEWVWTGVATGVPYTDPITGQTRVGMNYNARSLHERVIGTRNGSYLKFSDYNDTGCLVLEVFGSDGSVERKGPAIMISGKPGKNFLALTDSAGNRSVVIDSNPDAPEISINDKEHSSCVALGKESVDILAFEKTSVKMKKDAITILDGSKNSVTMDSKGITIKDANGLEVQLTSSGIVLKSGDAAAWCPNTLAVCPFTGAVHGGTSAGIAKLKGG